MIALPELTMRSVDTRWTRAHWEALPDDGNRYEIIDGMLYMSTSPSAFHQWIIRQVARVLYDQIDDVGVGVTFTAPLGVFMPGCDPVQPDLIVVRREQMDIVQARIEGVPALLVEVLSPSNPLTDRETKYRAYARAGVPEYWIVRPLQRDVLVHSQPDPALGDYLQCDHIAPDGELVSPTLPVRVAASAFFADAPSTQI